MAHPSRRDVLKASALSMAAIAGAPFVPDCGADEDLSKKRLATLLRENQAHEWRHGYYTRLNHVPMVLIALYRLGASPERMSSYFTSRPRPRNDITRRQRALAFSEKNWTDALGSRSALHAYVRFFRREVERRGVSATLGTYVPRLMEGAAAAAFHSLIKLGYALDIGDEEEVCLALAYWAVSFLQVPDTPGERKAVAFPEFAQSLAASAALAKVRSGGGIQERMAAVYKRPEFRALLRPIAIDEARPLDVVARTIMEAFTAHQHFTLLHGLTSTHALRMVMPHVEKPVRPVTAFCHALGAAYLTALNMAHHDSRVPLPAKHPGEAALEARATQSNDDHVVKVTYSCLSEHAAYGRETYLLQAARDQATPARFT